MNAATQVAAPAPWPGARCGTVLLFLLGVVCAAPAAAQGKGGAEPAAGVQPAAGVPVDAVPADALPMSAVPMNAVPMNAVPADGGWGAEFWARLRAEARRFRETHAAPFSYALRYRISRELARSIHDAAREEGIDPELAFRLVRVESNFNPRARSHAGALGLTQLMPYTARMVDRRMNTTARVLEPEANLRVGFRYLRRLIRHYDGDVRLALVAYNRGEGAVDRDLRRGRDPENGYARRVLGLGGDRYRGTGVHVEGRGTAAQ